MAAEGIESHSWDSIGVFLRRIGALVVSYDEMASSVDDWLDQGGVLWIRWIVYTHNNVVGEVYSLGQDGCDFPVKEKQLVILLRFGGL